MFDQLNDLLEFLRLVNRSTMVPLSLAENENIHTAFCPLRMDVNLASACLRPYMSSSAAIGFLYKEDYYCGMVRIKDSGYTVLAGPVPAVTFHEKELRALTESMQFDIKLRKDLRSYFSRVPVITQSHFLSVLRLLNRVLNQSEAPVCPLGDTDITTAPSPTDKEESFDPEKVRLYESEEYIVHNSRDIENKMLSAIVRGDNSELLSLLYNIRFSDAAEGRMSDSSLRNTRYTFVTAATLAARAAYQAGVDFEYALSMSDRYISQMDRCDSILQIYPLLGVMLLDFCDKAAMMIRDKDQSALSGQIRKDVQAHLHEPLRVEDIAERLGKSVSHLSHTFTADTGMTIRQFITDEKIREAKMRLLATDQSLSEIANSLSFSSQQYFQTVFKKCTGMTPAEFRRSQANKLQMF